MRKQVLGAILAILCSVQGQLQAATPADAVVLDGLTTQVPADAGWNRVDGPVPQAVFERTTEGQRGTLMFSVTPIAPMPDDQAFFRFAEARQAETFARLERVSVHYNLTHEQGAPCVSYDGIFEDKGDSASAFVSVRGLLCRHPGSAARMIQMELAQRSGSRDSAYKVDLSETAKQVFGDARFTEVHGDPQPGK